MTAPAAPFEPTPEFPGYVPLHVVFESHPSQERLPEDERDAVKARRRGAEWTARGHMRAGPRASAEDVRWLLAAFAGDEALRRAEAARQDLAPAVSRQTLCAAANAEVAGRGEAVRRAWIATDPVPAERRILWSVPSRHARFSAQRLDRLLNDAGLDVGFEENQGSPAFGQRYVAAATALPARLLAFAGREAEEAARVWGEKRAAGRDLTARVANSLAAGASGLRRPLLLPLAGGDVEALAETTARVRAAPAERIEALRSTTHREMEIVQRAGGGRARVAVAALEASLALLRAAHGPAAPSASASGVGSGRRFGPGRDGADGSRG